MKVPWRTGKTIQAGRSGYVFMAWHRHTSLTNFIVQSRSFEGVYIRSASSQELSLPRTRLSTYGDRVQSPLYGSGAVFRSISHLLRHFPSSTLALRPTVLKVMADILLALMLTLLDLSAAFDSVDHDTLLKRLQKSCGLGGQVLNWFTSYILCGRVQHVYTHSGVVVPERRSGKYFLAGTAFR